MLWYQIREFWDADYSAVRTLYSTGFREHVGTVYLLSLKQPWTQAVLCGVFLLIYILSSSFLTRIMGVCRVMLAGRMAVQYIFELGILLGLSEGLLDIRNSYMQIDNRSCFWVAELKGSIDGTVGILPCVEETGALELKRISVKREFRGRGLAKALCKTALLMWIRGWCFSPMVQTDAHKLHKFAWPSLPASSPQEVAVTSTLYGNRHNTLSNNSTKNITEGFRTQFCLFCSPAEGSTDISAVALLSHTHLAAQINIQQDLHWCLSCVLSGVQSVSLLELNQTLSDTHRMDKGFSDES
ncbi:unnamed protein product [Leuciscus chuanchicus]